MKPRKHLMQVDAQIALQLNALKVKLLPVIFQSSYLKMILRS